MKEGVYELDPGSRLDNLVDLAGGLTQKANVKAINLAMVLEDEMKIHIPYEGEDLEELVQDDSLTKDQGSSSSSGQTSKEAKVDLNKASMEELMTLSGIGEKKAQDIIDYRERQKFTKIEDLMEVSGIGEKTFEKLRDFIKVN